jgi:hypothetical protein
MPPGTNGRIPRIVEFEFAGIGKVTWFLGRDLRVGTVDSGWEQRRPHSIEDFSALEMAG